MIPIPDVSGVNTGSTQLDTWVRFVIILMFVGWSLWQNRKILDKIPGLSTVRQVRIEKKVDRMITLMEDHISDQRAHPGAVEKPAAGR